MGTIRAGILLSQWSAAGLFSSLAWMAKVFNTPPY